MIRCVEISSLTERTDKFRLCLFEHGMRRHIGEKEITALVLPTKKSAEVKVSHECNDRVTPQHDLCPFRLNKEQSYRATHLYNVSLHFLCKVM